MTLEENKIFDYLKTKTKLKAFSGTRNQFEINSSDKIKKKTAFEEIKRLIWNKGSITSI
jgi:hypothetical protein